MGYDSGLNLRVTALEDLANLVRRPALAFMVDTNQKFGDHARHHQHAGRDKHHHREKNKDVVVEHHWNTRARSDSQTSATIATPTDKKEISIVSIASLPKK